MLKEKMELVGSVEVADDVHKKVKTVGVRGLDFKKAEELGVFQRIGNILTVMHATFTAANFIYGHAAYMMEELEARRNDIAREMNMFDKAYARFLNFWTVYYANGKNGREVMRESQNLYHRIMEWAQIPEKWQFGEPQRTDDNDFDIAIRIDSEQDERLYTFRKTSLDYEVVDTKETWGVLCYDVETDKQNAVYTDIDKASALMVAKRLSDENPKNIYTAAIINDVVEKRTDVTPFKAFRANESVGSIMKVDKSHG